MLALPAAHLTDVSLITLNSYHGESSNDLNKTINHLFNRYMSRNET